MTLPQRPLLFVLAAGLAATGLLVLPSRPVSAQAPAARAQAPATGMVTIEADRQQADNQNGIVTATGNVRIVYADRGMTATSRQAQYFSNEGRLVLTGDVDVIDTDGQRLRAERLVYQLDSERMVAEPPAGQQVFSRFRLQQQGSAKPATAKPATIKP
ncbi:LPS export ABC transporter periplasmic protein LptC [Synechococcus sp. BA-132 BA5]|uniref:LPS export ABC transporter periplasmic protein LptC n=1 Tax=Synechococcus sp. BA-132 BA5 TaxID=3110252 RepID=UPI002B20A5CD|nr:LptA/OstA family protein [Synechococcus sp. BA-132 BA5]MEA5413759.1 LptA/OstA family protein [Synechococcus sp. BA-132 BA5]